MVATIVPWWQVFVANPNKTTEITEVLARNKDKLLKYLGDFHTDKGAPHLGAIHILFAQQPSLICAHPEEMLDPELLSLFCAEDEQFKEEKAVIIKEISMLHVSGEEDENADEH